ncbi:MAG TPA: hypothetical protein VJY83_00320 [Thiopseudomonas sp.]|nr:hypothetical protein [Thiopseudomonas sp.]
MDILSAGRTLGGSNDGLDGKAKQQAAIKPQTKIERILQAFIAGQSLHRFQAFALRDTCLHSTVSALEQGYNLQFKRRAVIVDRQGDPVRVVEYWLHPESLDKAAKVLDAMRQRREHQKTGC